MAIDYDNIAAGALESIAEAGQVVTLHKPGTDGEYVPGVGEQPGTAGQDFTGTGALFGYKQRDIDGAKIMRGDQRLLLAPQVAEVPDITWFVTAIHLGKPTKFSIKDLEAVGPAGAPVLFKLQLRGV